MLHHLVSVAVLLSAGLITAQAENVNDFESLALVRRYKAASRAQSLVRRAPSPCSTDTTNTEVWEPEVGTEWQIVLQSNLKATNKFTPDVPVYDIDLFGNDDSVFKALKEQGKKIICYFSAGSYEPYRPDSDDFKASDKGSIMDGWEDENWLDINSDNVRAIMKKRIELAADRGCGSSFPFNSLLDDSYGGNPRRN